MLFNQQCHCEKVIMCFMDRLSVNYLAYQQITCTNKMENNSLIAIIQHISHAWNGVYLEEYPPLISGKLAELFFSLCNFGWNKTNIWWNFDMLHALVNCWTLLFGQLLWVKKSFFTIHLPMPRNRQCIRFTIINETGSK